MSFCGDCTFLSYSTQTQIREGTKQTVFFCCWYCCAPSSLPTKRDFVSGNLTFYVYFANFADFFFFLIHPLKHRINRARRRWPLRLKNKKKKNILAIVWWLLFLCLVISLLQFFISAVWKIQWCCVCWWLFYYSFLLLYFLLTSSWEPTTTKNTWDLY